jgi:hypothetical protein
MKKLGLLLAFLACVSFSVTPMVPAAAAPSRAETEQRLASHVARGELVVVTPAQMERLAATHPRLHAKLEAASRDGTAPRMTAGERRIVAAMTAENLDQLKAGWAPAGWIIVGIAAAILLVILWEPVICRHFPGAPFCPAPAPPVVAAAG